MTWLANVFHIAEGAIRPVHILGPFWDILVYTKSIETGSDKSVMRCVISSLMIGPARGRSARIIDGRSLADMIIE